MPDLDEKALARAFDGAMQSLADARIIIAHPLGFLILDQVPDGAGGYSRLHLWERARMRPEIPHSHSGDLRSTILAGTLANTTWELSDVARNQVSIVAVRKDARSVRRYHPVGVGGFTAGRCEHHVSGQSYFVAAGAFHSSECLSDIAVTLVRRSPSQDAPAQIAISDELAIDRRRRIALPDALRDAALALMRTERERLGCD